jgi:hypothetical protein
MVCKYNFRYLYNPQDIEKHKNLDPISKDWICTGKKKTLIAAKLKSVVVRQRFVRQFEAKVVKQLPIIRADGF